MLRVHVISVGKLMRRSISAAGLSRSVRPQNQTSFDQSEQESHGDANEASGTVETSPGSTPHALRD